MMVGLQGSGKTTTTAKIAKRLTDQMRRKVLMASLDTRRPAAMEQLAVLGTQVGVETLPIVAGQTPVQIAQRAMKAARLGGYDAVLLDTAGRITLDEEMMTEAADVRRAANPHEVLLVADALTGQDAVNLARSFNERVGLDRHRADARRRRWPRRRRAVDARCHRQADQADRHRRKDRRAGRLRSRARRRPHSRHGRHRLAGREGGGEYRHEKAARTAERMRKGQFDLNDLREQLEGMMKMGGIGGLMGMMPGIAKMKNQMAAANLDDKVLKRQVAIIGSMTPKERRNPDLLKASRKKRIAAGSGTKVEEINKLLKMHWTMADVMKAMGSGKRGPMAGLANMMGFGRRHAVAGRNAKACGKNAGRTAAGHAGRCAVAAGKISGRTARSWRAEIAARRISRTWEEEVTHR